MPLRPENQGKEGEFVAGVIATIVLGVPLVAVVAGVSWWIFKSIAF